MRIAADARDSLEAEVEKLSLEPSLVQERNEERAEAAVYVKAELLVKG